jgi:hypothetical protein
LGYKKIRPAFAGPFTASASEKPRLRDLTEQIDF